MSNIQQTTDYSIFKQIVSNREVDQAHVNKLVKSISKNNLLHLNHIVVNPGMEVIDGQHRLEAAEKLGLPIFYIVDAAVSKKDLSDLNSVKKNWSTMDYINYWAIEKAPGFDVLSKFLSEHSKLPPSTALMLLSLEGKRDMSALKSGSVDVLNINEATEVAGVLKKFRNIIDWAYDRNFVLAIYKLIKTGKYDPAVMEKKLETQSRSLVKCINVKQYVELLEEIYNRGSHNKISFKYS
ncbi:ParB/Srx family N-terminal domain-containing protein [Pedobacter sp.]|uniref:ParB/Srx family N-terminal domain-containing protein n=1 Tax=Pedobacter sp. TaxID=1411316 RepID=UPI003D7F1FF1